MIHTIQGLIQLEKIDIDVEKSSDFKSYPYYHFSQKKHCSLKESNRRMTPDYDYDDYGA